MSSSFALRFVESQTLPPLSASAPVAPFVRLREPTPEDPSEAEPDDEDSLWVLAAQRGEHRAFEKLVKKHQQHAVAIAMALVKDEDDACEVVQEAFLRVHRGLREFKGTSSFFTWFYRIVTNLSIDLIRKPMRRVTGPLDAETLETAVELPCFARIDTDPFENLCRRELVARIHARMGELPLYHRGVIIMRELDGLSYEEMAFEMGVSKGTIMSRLFHARQKLQRSLFAEYGEQSGGGAVAACGRNEDGAGPIRYLSLIGLAALSKSSICALPT